MLFDVGRVGERHAQVLGLPALVAAGQVGVAEQAGRGVPEDLVGQILVAVGRLAHRVVAAVALVALAAGDRERDDDAVADLELALGLGPDLDHLAHRLVAHHVAALHAGHEAVEEVQVGAADRRARDLHDRVARVFDLGIGHRVAADVLRAVPDQRAHDVSPQVRVRVVEGAAAVVRRPCRPGPARDDAAAPPPAPYRARTGRDRWG
jgi:hypothetical protein